MYIHQQPALPRLFVFCSLYVACYRHLIFRKMTKKLYLKITKNLNVTNKTLHNENKTRLLHSNGLFRNVFRPIFRFISMLLYEVNKILIIPVDRYRHDSRDRSSVVAK